VASRRLQELFALQGGIQHELNRALVGETPEVLVTGWGRQPNTQTGRTTCHRVVNFRVAGAAPALGSLTRVRIDEALPHSLVGHQDAAAA
jgi:tRNA A37 methylthiotransferase MiaB